MTTWPTAPLDSYRLLPLRRATRGSPRSSYASRAPAARRLPQQLREGDPLLPWVVAQEAHDPLPEMLLRHPLAGFPVVEGRRGDAQLPRRLGLAAAPREP